MRCPCDVRASVDATCIHVGDDNCIRFISLYRILVRACTFKRHISAHLTKPLARSAIVRSLLQVYPSKSKQELQDNKDSHFASNFIPADATGRTGCYQQVSLTFVSHLAQSDRAVRSFDSFSLRSCSPFRDKLRRSFTAGNMEHTSFR